MSENERVLWHQLAEFAERLRLSELEHDRICCELKEQIECLEYDLGQAEGRRHDAEMYWRTARETLQSHNPEEFPNCRIDINAVLKELDSLEEKRSEPKWYDAKKCLPLPEKEIIAEVESEDKNTKVNHAAELIVLSGRPVIILTNCPRELGPFKLLKWRYADESINEEN